MRRYINQPRIRRNHNTGRFLVFSGLALLAGGFIYSRNNPDEVNLVLLVAVLGTVTAQLGLAMINRWGRSPRIDERVDASLKGLNDDWAVLHYAGPTDHILFGPPGCIALLPRDEKGVITFRDGAWFQDKPPGGLLRRGGEVNLRALGGKAQRAINNLRVLLENHFETAAEPIHTEPLLLFMNDQATLDLDAEELPIPAVHHKKVKAWLRRLSGGVTPTKRDVDVFAANVGLVANS
jgi:hypothetical protein